MTPLLKVKDFIVIQVNWRSKRTHTVMGVIAALLVVLIVGIPILMRKAAPAADAPRVREVQLAGVSDIANDSAPLPVVGQVSSVSEAEIRTESAGRITRLNYKLGDSVSAGSSIAEIENSLQRASVTSAEGALESARAAAAKVAGGTRSEQLDIARSGATGAETARTQSRIAAVNAIKSVYNTNDDIVHAKLDPMFSNPRGATPHFTVPGTDTSLINSINQQRELLEGVLRAEASRAANLTSASDLSAELKTAQEETAKVRDFTDDVSSALSHSIPFVVMSQATIDGYTAVASGARSTASGALATLTGTAQDLAGKESGYEIAQKQLQQGVKGAQSEDIAASNAGVKQAQGAYESALAALEKTIVRAPISGTLNSLTLNKGDFVAPSQQVAVISNNGALEVTAYVTEDDRQNVHVGAPVTIEGKYNAVVTKVASAIDPVTHKIEVKIGFTDGTGSLTNGQSVSAEISRRTKGDASKLSKNAGPIAIPLAAVKINSDTMEVFTVSASSTLIAHPVTLGSLMGDKVQILTGLMPDMRIVTDVRGLKEGEAVTIKK